MRFHHIMVSFLMGLLLLGYQNCSEMKFNAQSALQEESSRSNQTILDNGTGYGGKPGIYVEFDEERCHESELKYFGVPVSAAIVLRKNSALLVASECNFLRDPIAIDFKDIVVGDDTVIYDQRTFNRLEEDWGDGGYDYSDSGDRAEGSDNKDSDKSDSKSGDQGSDYQAGVQYDDSFQFQLPQFGGGCDESFSRFEEYIASSSFPPKCNFSPCDSEIQSLNNTEISVTAVSVGSINGTQAVAQVDQVDSFMVNRGVLKGNRADNIRGNSLFVDVNQVGTVGANSLYIKSSRIESISFSNRICAIASEIKSLEGGYNIAELSGESAAKPLVIDVLDLRLTNSTTLNHVHVKTIVDSKTFPALQSRVKGTFTYDQVVHK